MIMTAENVSIHTKRITSLLSLMFVGLALPLGWGFYRNSRIEAHFKKVTVGASSEVVQGLMGQPSWIEPCGESFGTTRPNCNAYIYRNSFAPLIPEYYSLSVDTSGHVIYKYVYESP